MRITLNCTSSHKEGGPGLVAGYPEATCEREPAFIEKK
jgi:hypothetical protein